MASAFSNPTQYMWISFLGFPILFFTLVILPWEQRIAIYWESYYFHIGYLICSLAAPVYLLYKIIYGIVKLANPSGQPNNYINPFYIPLGDPADTKDAAWQVDDQTFTTVIMAITCTFTLFTRIVMLILGVCLTFTFGKGMKKAYQKELEDKGKSSALQLVTKFLCWEAG